MDLSTLIPFLKSHGVSRFKDQNVEVEFHIPLNPTLSTQDHMIEVPEPKDMPADLRADDLMNEKKILEWSAPPGPESDIEPPMPLTGETALESLQ